MMTCTFPYLVTPAPEPGSRFLHAAEEQAGPRIKSGVTAD